MHTPSTDDLIIALSTLTGDDLSAALTRAGEPAVTHLADALLDAATRLAYYPRDDVIAEADALLYDVLRWPITDTNPTFPREDDVTALARHRRIPITEARRIIDHLVATESQAVDLLLRSGVEPDFTREQAQVLTCIQQLTAQGTSPTRALVRAHATDLARGSLRPGDSPDPVVYPRQRHLSARIVSNHPATHAIMWLDRLDADPTPLGHIDDRITFLAASRTAIGRSSVTAHRLTTRTPDPLAPASCRSGPHYSQATFATALSLP